MKKTFLTIIALGAMNVWAMGQGTWTSGQSMPTSRYNLSVIAAEYSGDIFAIGGQGGAGIYDRVERYSPWIDTWDTACARMPKPKMSCGTGAVADVVYLIGGSDAATYFSSVYAYNTLENTWDTLKTPMPQGPRSEMASAAFNGVIYLFGGSNGGLPLNRVEAYDPIADTAGGIPWQTK